MKKLIILIVLLIAISGCQKDKCKTCRVVRDDGGEQLYIGGSVYFELCTKEEQDQEFTFVREDGVEVRCWLKCR